MERPVYMYAWLPGRPNCHPVHTLKNIGMVEDMVRSHATMLCWSMMGSGAISLPFLEQQIYGELPPQLRFHGYLNEYEFNKKCLEEGIIPYAVIYEAQSWEFPVELNETKTRIHKINMDVDSKSQNPGEYGLREFTQNTYPLFNGRTFEDYFPDGIKNSDGKYVTDLYDECCCRDMYGNPTHSHWVEVRGLPQTCRGTCRNNPVWREYLKKQINILVDAGAKAIQLDETETPLTSLGYGGCFCKDCMKQFRTFLQKEKEEGKLPADMQDLDLDIFDYGEFLRDHGFKWDEKKYSLPFFNEYWKFQIKALNLHFQELVNYARSYGKKTRGYGIRISANFTNMFLLYYPSLKYTDCCTTELRRTVFKRHNWFRLAAGYSEDKPVIIAESPYDEFIPNFVKLIHKGKADDYYRVFMMEAAINGLSMAMPYGAWMGNGTYDSFDAPYQVREEVQDFLKDNDQYFSKKSGAKVLVLYSSFANIKRDYMSGAGEHLVYDAPEDLYSYKVRYDDGYDLPFYSITQDLVDSKIPFDVKVMGDGEIVEDTLNSKMLDGYQMIVLPDGEGITESQKNIILRYAKNHKVYIDSGNSDSEDVFSGTDGNISVFRNDQNAMIHQIVSDYENIRTEIFTGNDVYVQKNVTDKAVVYHILNYQYDVKQSKTIPQTVSIEIMNKTGAEDLSNIIVKTFGQTLPCIIAENNNHVVISVDNCSCYAMVVIPTMRHIQPA